MTGRRPFESKPIGGDFGISVELPRLADVVDYEEGRINLTHGYPRFVPNRVVTAREDAARNRTGASEAIAFPSEAQAKFFLSDHMRREDNGSGVVESGSAAGHYLDVLHDKQGQGSTAGPVSDHVTVFEDGLSVVCISDEEEAERLRLLRRTWGSGFDVHALAGSQVEAPEGFEVDAVARRISSLEGPNAVGTLLYQSGMAAISCIAVAAAVLGRRLVLIGSAYVDTATIGEGWGDALPGLSTTWLPDDFSTADLERTLSLGPALIILEVPSNPKLLVPDVNTIVGTAGRHDAILAVDATIATPFNWQPLDHGFNLVMHSTSKFLGGMYDHLGGVVTSSSADLLGRLDKIRTALDLGMCRNQAAILHRNLDGFATRMKTINTNGAIIAERLLASDRVGQVYYPGYGSEDQQNLVSAVLPEGRGGLLSFVLDDPGFDALERFYDKVRLPVIKGPGLGGEMTLMCPYVMLAHYHATDGFLRERDLPFHLVRLSVGVEPVDQVWEAISRSF